MKVLITGGNGMLGRTLQHVLADHTLVIADLPDWDITRPADFQARLAAARGIPKMAAQAVGGAVGGNPIAIVVPCHRVIGAHGNLTGYGGGMERKIALLKLEGVDLSQMTVPRPKRPRS